MQCIFKSAIAILSTVYYYVTITVEAKNDYQSQYDTVWTENSTSAAISILLSISSYEKWFKSEYIRSDMASAQIQWRSLIVDLLLFTIVTYTCPNDF